MIRGARSPTIVEDVQDAAVGLRVLKGKGFDKFYRCVDGGQVPLEERDAEEYARRHQSFYIYCKGEDGDTYRIAFAPHTGGQRIDKARYSMRRERVDDAGACDKPQQ